MSPSSQESKLSVFRESLAQLNSEFFLLLQERRKVSMQIQELKGSSGHYSHYDPEREFNLYSNLENELKSLHIKELLAFSLLMEDHAMAMAPGSYPSWSARSHLQSSDLELFEMINPLLLKISHLDLFKRLKLLPDFLFLNDF